MNLTQNRRRLALASVAGLLFLAIFAALWFFSSNRRVATIQQLRARLTSEAGRRLTPQQRRELWEQMREQMRQLTPMERRELDKGRREQMKRYFSMPKKDKIAYLDQQIRRMEAARRQREVQASNSQRLSNANFGPRMRTFDPEERDKRRRERLDFSTAEERADRAQFRKDLDQRRAQLGLAPMRGGWGRRQRS